MKLSARKIKVIRMLAGLEVRFSEEADGEYWGRWLTEKAVMDWYPMEGPQERAESVQRMQSWCKYRTALTGVYQGQVAGIAYLNLHPYRKIAHQALFTIIVSEKFRGLGIGKNLLEHLERLAKESFGVEILYLEVYEGNPAIRLYRRLGYQEFGFQSHWICEKKGEYRGKIMMAKEL